MGAAWYDFACFTAAAIPVPKGALQKPFNLQGFKLMTIVKVSYEDDMEFSEYHGALICLPDTQLHRTSVEVIGPYEIQRGQVKSRRMSHLDSFMTAETRDRLSNAFETYTGRKSEDVPGFWSVCASRSQYVELHSTWSLDAMDAVFNENDDCIYGKKFDYTIQRDP